MSGSAASSSTVPSSTPPPAAFGTMPEQAIKQLLRRLNISRPQMAEAVGIKEGTFKRWMRLDCACFKDDNLQLLRTWLTGHSLADIQSMHSRNHSREVHSEVQTEVRQGPVTPTKFRRLKRRCETAQAESMPPPTKPKISKAQVQRIVKTKESRI